MVFAALAMVFFVRYSLSEEQVLAVVAGAMFIPLVSGLAPFDVPAGAPFAALIYVACIVAAWARQGTKRGSNPEKPYEAGPG